MPTQTTDQKAREYLIEGRVRAEVVNAAVAVFRVTGTRSTPYMVRYNSGYWRCDCPARVTCCHVKACSLIAPPAAPVGHTAAGAGSRRSS